MAEYIDREKMLKYLEETNTDNDWVVGQYNADWIYSFIESQPTADVVEVKHGEWEEREYGMFFACSNCEYLVEYQLTNYCPHCGAKMYGEREDT